MLLLVNLLDVLVPHGSQAEPLVAVFALIDLLVLAQVIVVKMNSQAVKKGKNACLKLKIYRVTHLVD